MDVPASFGPRHIVFEATGNCQPAGHGLHERQDAPQGLLHHLLAVVRHRITATTAAAAAAAAAAASLQERIGICGTGKWCFLAVVISTIFSMRNYHT